MSKTVLEKLGYKPGMAGWVVDRPAGLIDHIALPEQRVGDADLIVVFVTSIADVAARLPQVIPHYRRGGGLWFAYPKKTGAIKTDISRDNGWDALVAIDLLPVTQIAIDDTWSALRFRYRDEIARLTRKTDLPGLAAA